MPSAAFYQHLDDLAAQALAQGAAACVPGVLARAWNLPSAYPAGADLQDPGALASACDRHELNSRCVAAYATGAQANAGRIGEVMAFKLAIDYQAAYERALHARHASATRCRAWAAARRTGHGDGTYGVFGVVRRMIDATLAAATERPNTPGAANL